MKAVRLVGYAFGGLSAAYAGYYTVLYLPCREWQRALISGVLLLVVEVFLATVLLLARLSRLSDRQEQSDARVEDVLKRLEQSRSPAPDRFNWLASVDRAELGGTQRTFVFAPVLMAAGAALSGLAMVIQRPPHPEGRRPARLRRRRQVAGLRRSERASNAATSAVSPRTSSARSPAPCA